PSAGKYNLVKKEVVFKPNADDKLILKAIGNGFKSNKKITNETRLSYDKVVYRLGCLIKKKLIVKIEFGHYDLPGKEENNSSFAVKEAEDLDDDDFESELKERD
ncbi:unnamed protein product, partial [marine sediment metagenome]